MASSDTPGDVESCKISYASLPEIIAIDLPFFATSSASAYSTLGGEENVKALIRDGAKSLSLKFPSLNCLQGSVIGEKLSTGGGLLLRIRRKKCRVTCSPESCSMEDSTSVQVIGRVDQIYQFNQPADYQFLPETTGLLPITGPQDVHRTLETIPRPFCRTQIGAQTDFLFKDLSFDSEKYFRKKRETGQYHQIKFGDPIPEELNAEATKTWESTARTGTKIKIIEVKLALSQKLKEKPIWKKKQLDLYEPFKSLMYVFFEVLPLLSFGYISGPFKGYIVRYGYDAAKHPESRFLQVLHYRMNKREFNNVKQRITNHVGIQSIGKCIDLDHMIVYDDKKYHLDTPSKGACVIVFMGIEFKQQQSFQVCDLADEDLMLFIQKMKRLEVCGKDGWFHLGAITIIRDKFREFVLQKIEEFLSKPRFCNTTSTDSTGKSSGVVENDGSGASSSSSSGPSAATSEDIYTQNNIALGVRMKYWQDRYLALPDSGVASEADLAVYQNYADAHRRKSGMKSHRLQRIFRMVGKSLGTPKEGRQKLEGSRRDRGKRNRPMNRIGGRSRKARKKEVSADSDSDSDDQRDYGEEDDGEENQSKRVSFAGDRGRGKQSNRRSKDSSSSHMEHDAHQDINNSSPCRNRDATVYTEEEVPSGSRSSSRARRSSRSNAGAGSSGVSSSQVDTAEAFSFFDDGEEDDDEDDDDDDDEDDDSSNSGSDDDDNDGVADPFDSYEPPNYDNDNPGDEEEEEYEEGDDDGRADAQDYSSNSAWL